MPTFYFDIFDGAEIRDDHGMECRDIVHAKERAKRLLPEIALEELPQTVGDIMAFVVTVRNDQAASFTQHTSISKAS